MSKIKIIGYCGPIGSGKDYEANKLIVNDKFIKVSFADELLEDLWIMIKWKPKDHADYENFKSMKINDDCVGRDLIKNYGETMKKLHGEEYWLNKWHKKIYTLMARGHNKFVIPDVRFEKDFSYIKQLNGKIYFTRIESEKLFLDRHSESEKIAIDLYDKNIQHLEDITNLF